MGRPKGLDDSELFACGLAEGIEAGDGYEVGAANSECLELGAVDAALDPLVDGLAGHRRVYALPGFFDAQILLCVAVAGPSPFGRATSAKSCERVS